MKQILISQLSPSFINQLKTLYPEIEFQSIDKASIGNIIEEKIKINEFSLLLLSREDFNLLKNDIPEKYHEIGILYSNILEENLVYIQDNKISYHLCGTEDEISLSLNHLLNPIKFSDEIEIKKIDWQQNITTLDILQLLLKKIKTSKIAFDNLTFIIAELVNNVFTHTKSQAAKVSLQIQDRSIWIQVENEGADFKKNKIKKSILAHERQTHTEENKKGAGIGLYLIFEMASDIVIKAENNETVVSVSIPERRTSWSTSLIKKNIILRLED